MELYTEIKKSQVFEGLDESSIVKLLMHTHYQVKIYYKDNIIAHKNDELKWFMLVLKGSVRGEMNNVDGKILKIEDINEGRAIALAFLFGENNQIPVNVVANCYTEILKIDKFDFLKMLQNNLLILENLLTLISNRSNFLANKVEFLTLKTIKGKYAYYLLQNINPQTNTIHLNINQEQLAELFGVTRPSLGRAISELVSENVIVVSGKTVTATNLEALINYSKQ
jgi:CRP/FNR family transcriptional regulator, dissimilatory nitrate respiration regulator